MKAASPVWSSLLGSLVRWGLLFIFAPLVSRGILTQGDADSTVAGAVPDIVAWLVVLGALVWSFVQKWLAERRVDVALSLPGGATKEDLDLKIASKVPLTMVLVCALAVILAMPVASGCRTSSVEPPSSGHFVESPRSAVRVVAILGETFDTTMKILVELRRERLIDNETWKSIDAAQREVNFWSPILLDALDVWKNTGNRTEFDRIYSRVYDPVKYVESVRLEVAP